MNLAKKVFRGFNGNSLFSKNLVNGNYKTQIIRTFCTKNDNGNFKIIKNIQKDLTIATQMIPITRLKITIPLKH